MREKIRLEKVVNPPEYINAYYSMDIVGGKTLRPYYTNVLEFDKIKERVVYFSSLHESQTDVVFFKEGGEYWVFYMGHMVSDLNGLMCNLKNGYNNYKNIKRAIEVMLL